MAVTIYHKIINNNHIRIENKVTKPEQKAIKVKADISTTKHTITETKE